MGNYITEYRNTEQKSSLLDCGRFVSHYDVSFALSITGTDNAGSVRSVAPIRNHGNGRRKYRQRRVSGHSV